MKVLISDDEHHVIQAIRLLVPWEEFGIDQIYTASNGMEALDIITREVPEIVITDIVMEDKNGIDIMDFIATRHPSIKVIAVSGHNDFEYVRTMLTKGCMDYLLKPLESATLISTVGKLSLIHISAFCQSDKILSAYWKLGLWMAVIVLLHASNTTSLENP